MSAHTEWSAHDIAELWDYAEQQRDAIVVEAAFYRHVSQALAQVQDEPPYVPPFGPTSMPVAPPIPGWERALMDEPDDQPDETLPAWTALIRSGLRLAGRCSVAAVLCLWVGWAVGSR